MPEQIAGLSAPLSIWVRTRGVGYQPLRERKRGESAF